MSRAMDVVTLTGEEYDALLADKDRLDWLQDAAKGSRTGLTIQFMHGHRADRGWRLMKFHAVSRTEDSLRAAIDAEGWK